MNIHGVIMEGLNDRNDHINVDSIMGGWVMIREEEKKMTQSGSLEYLQCSSVCNSYACGHLPMYVDVNQNLGMRYLHKRLRMIYVKNQMVQVMDCSDVTK